MSVSSARMADKRGSVKEAIRLYEKAISQGNAEYIDYVNLICIYFNCLDLGYASALKIEPNIEKGCVDRAFFLITEAEKKFGRKDELTFWKGIIPYLGWGDPVGEWELIGDSLVPYIYLAMENQTEKNMEKAKRLYSELKSIEESERKRLFIGRLEMLFDQKNS